MSENKNSNDDKRKEDEQDPFDFFKLSTEPKDNGDDDKKQKKLKGLWIFLLIVGILVVLINISGIMQPNDTIPFSKFQENVRNGVYEKVDLSESYFIGYPIGTYTSEKTDNPNPLAMLRGGSSGNEKPDRTFGILSQNFLLVLDEQTKAQPGFEYKMVPTQHNFLLEFIMSWVLPFGLIFLMWRLMFKKIGGGMGGMGSIFGAGQSRHNAVDEGQVKTRFTDVAGVDEAKEELMEVVDFLKAPKKYTDIGGKIPKGVLLVGPPGTGKTLLARAVAGEAGVPFFRISGSDFVEMFVGVGASRVRDLFKQAREKAPCIIFIDELDALGKSRQSGLGSNDEREQTLNQLLVEMDGFDNDKGLIILAATNRADVLDAALLRPGRFDRQVPVEKPDVKGREEILRIHAKNVKLDNDVDFESVAHGTTGFAGADLANVVNEAALLAVRNGRKKVTMTDFNDAIDKVSIGLKKKSRKDNEKEMRLVSIHETGHALMGAFTPNYPPVNKITVVPRSHGVGGFTQYREEEERNFRTKTDMVNEIDICLGGRAAEEILLKDVSTGASNDIARATEIIKNMITVYGMSDKFKNMTLGKGVLGQAGGEFTTVREFSEETQKYIDEEISRIVEERYQYVISKLTEHKDLLEYIANRLLVIETMDGKEFYEIVKGESHCKAIQADASVASTEADENSSEEKSLGENSSEEN